jgi:hypothetical protein
MPYKSFCEGACARGTIVKRSALLVEGGKALLTPRTLSPGGPAIPNGI